MVLGDGPFGSWLGCEGEALESGLIALIKETLESTLDPSAMSGHSEKTAVYEPWNKLPPDTETASILILKFPASRTVRNKCLLFKSLSVWCFCYGSPNGLRHFLISDQGKGGV